MAQDAEGKPLTPYRGAALVVPARKKGTDNTAGSMVVSGLFEPLGAPGAYGVFMPAQVVTSHTQRGGPEGKVNIEETWTLTGPDGHSIDAQVQYERGTPARAKSESKAYSGAKPDFFRIYRVDSASDVARSTAMGVDRVSRISFRADGPKLAPLFDGTERLIGVTSIPLYSRQVFLPGPCGMRERGAAALEW